MYSPTGSSAQKNAATAPAPKEPNATATARSGRVRRHNSVEIATRASTTATAGQVRSSRSRPSSTAVGTSTATSTQSRHTRAGGAGARGSAHSDRAAVLIEPAYGTRAHGGIGRKYEAHDRPIGQGKSSLLPDGARRPVPSRSTRMSHLLYRLGRFCARRPFAVIGSWLVVSVLVIGASGAFGRELEDSFEAPGVDSQQATELLTAAGSDQAGLTAQLVVTPRDERATFFGSADARAALAEIQAGAAALPHVLGTSDPAGALAAGSEVAVRRGAVSADGRVALIRIRYPVLEELRADDLENLKAFGVQAAAGSPLRLEMGGDLFFAFEEPETGTGELVGLVAAAVILLVAFGSVIAMGLPIAIALFGLALGISSMALVTYLVDIPSWAPELGSMVGLGVGIDYALFLITRHREYLARGMPVEESVGRAVETAGQVIVFAGGTVVIAILGLAVAGVPMMTAAGIAIAAIVLIMVVASVTLLPAFLGLAGTWINRLGFRRIRARTAPGTARDGGAGASTCPGTRGPMPSASRSCSWR